MYSIQLDTMVYCKVSKKPSHDSIECCGGQRMQDASLDPFRGIFTYR